MTVIASLRRRREERGISQGQLARVLGTTQSAIARLESGSIAPRLDTIDRYAAAVDAELEVRLQRASPSAAAVAIRSALDRGQPGTAFRTGVQLLTDLSDLPATVLQEELRQTPGTTGSRRWDALLAGLTERAARRGGVGVPPWTAAPSRRLDSWWFPLEEITGVLPAGLACMVLAAPVPELAVRGVMVDRTSLP